MYIRTNNTIEKPCLFDINKICNDYITNQNKKFDLFSIKNYLKLILNHNQTTNTFSISTSSFFFKITINEINNLSNHFLVTEFYRNDLRIILEYSLHRFIDKFLDKGYTFSHIDEMNISAISDKMYMTYEYYLNHPKSMLEWKLNLIPARNPHLIKSLNRNHIHPSIRKYSHIR